MIEYIKIYFNLTSIVKEVMFDYKLKTIRYNFIKDCSGVYIERNDNWNTKSFRSKYNGLYRYSIKRQKTKVLCENCGSNENLEYTTNPYESELNDDFTLHYICKKCINLLLDEI